MSRRSLLPDLVPADPPVTARERIKTSALRLVVDFYSSTAGAAFMTIVFSFILIAVLMRD